MELEWFSINILIIVVASITIIFTLTTMISMIEILGCQELETLQGVRCFRRISDVGRQLGQVLSSALVHALNQCGLFVASRGGIALLLVNDNNDNPRQIGTFRSCNSDCVLLWSVGIDRVAV